jgi:hypothetical protein
MSIIPPPPHTIREFRKEGFVLSTFGEWKGSTHIVFASWMCLFKIKIFLVGLGFEHMFNFVFELM